MSIAVNVYRAINISAEAFHHNDTHWVVLTFNEPAQDFQVTAFFLSSQLADAYATAINAVQAGDPAPIAEVAA